MERMGKRIWIFAVAAAALAWRAVPARAQETYGARGFYVGGGYFGSFVHGDANNVSPPSSFKNAYGNGMGVEGFFGGPLTDGISGQIVYGLDFYGKNGRDLKAHYGTGELKFEPLARSRFSPFALAGIGVAIAEFTPSGPGAVDDTNVSFTWTVGAGLDIFVRPTVVLSPEVRLRYLKDRNSVTMFPLEVGLNATFYVHLDE